MKNVDIVFVTNLPSFYKIELYNQIASKKKIMVFFTGDKAWERNNDFFCGNIEFDYLYLEGPLFVKALKGIIYISRYKYKELIISGWDQLLCWFCAFLFTAKKNACVIESSIYESDLVGIRYVLKKIFMKRISKAYVCGKPHIRLIKALCFKGEIVTTGGCGILNYIQQPLYAPRQKVKHFLYVGRLIEIKNVSFLIEVFNLLPEFELKIIGFGPLEDKLKQIAKENIIFEGAIDNSQLPFYYQHSDVFILPSYSEPWGLVVEEALNNGLPVIVSNCVGCCEDLVTPERGIIFDIQNPNSLRDAILKISQIDYYNQLRKNVSQMDFADRVKKQLDCYL